MHVTIINHRPTLSRDILRIGTCVEIHSSKANLLCDVGMFFQPDDNFIKMLSTRETWQMGVTIPPITKKDYHCLISHGHIDHYAGLFSLDPKVNVHIYAGKLTYRLIKKTATQLEKLICLKEGVHYPRLQYVRQFEHANPLTIGDFSIVPLKVRHNIPDCWAFLIEHEKFRLLYAGEFMNKFWVEEPSLIRDVDVVIIGYLPEISIGKDHLLCRGKNDLFFYVTTGEDLESIESCFQNSFPLLLFKSPYVARFLNLLPKEMRSEFHLLNNSSLFQPHFLSHVSAPAIVACNYVELVRYLRNLPASTRVLVISNDFNLSKDVAACTKKQKLSQFKKTLITLKERGRFVDIFQNPHGTQALIKELLSYLLSFKLNIKVMITHAVDYSFLQKVFAGHIKVIDKITL